MYWLSAGSVVWRRFIDEVAGAISSVDEKSGTKDLVRLAMLSGLEASTDVSLMSSFSSLS